LKVINGIYGKGLPAPQRRAAMYYKTEPLVSGIGYHHTNNWEIVRAIQILNSRGFVVDLIDRTNGDWSPTHRYDLFLGLGVGNSGSRFAEYARRSGANKKILLAMGPQPDVSNKRTLARYDAFRERTGIHAPPMRTVNDVVGKSFTKIIEQTSDIFIIGEKGTKSYESFVGYEKPVSSFYPAVSSDVKFYESWKDTRVMSEFLCFAGNGLICKGVDLVVEAFLRDPSKKLHICGPHEKSFFDAYSDKITSSKNIEYHGFVMPGKEKFNQLSSKCSFVVFHPSAEGCCTSVATAMKAGLVPIINGWTGIHVSNHSNGITMSDDLTTAIDEISLRCEEAASMTKKQYDSMLEKSHLQSGRFSQDSFTKSYSSCIDRVINES
tara:strand:- start:20721 stop:21857 length:1137 start_codon:yes stop_codon:yes gene_type:complete